MVAAYLVTGGLGFLGASLVKALVRTGHRVRVFDNGSRGSTERLAGVLNDVEVIHGDVRDGAAVHRAVKGMDSVCHLAAVNGTRNFYERPAHVLEVGVKGMVNVIDACIGHGVGELFLASSSEVYQTAPTVPADEQVPLSVPDPYNPRYSYGGSKIISELMAIHYGRQYFHRVIIFRPHNVIGPDMGWDHVIPELTHRMLRLRRRAPGGVLEVPIQGTGEQTRAFIDVDDCVAGVVLLLDRGQHLNTYNIGTMEEVTIRTVALKIAERLRVRVRLVPGAAAAGGTLRRCPDIRKLQALGFAPRLSFDDTITRTVRWYAEHADLARAPEPAVPKD